MLNNSRKLNDYLITATKIARQAGQLVLEYYETDVGIDTKGGDTRNLVTVADLASEAMITEALQKAFPEFAILAEETYQPGDQLDEEVPTWLIDPIDGTSNFSHGLPFFAISIGLYYAGESWVGVIHAPAMDWTFAAAKGKGATLNGQPIGVNQHKEIRDIIVACDWARVPILRQKSLDSLRALGQEAHTMRSIGSAALSIAAVAAGWLGAYFNYLLYPWDFMAGAVIIQEAGGELSTLDGQRWCPEMRNILATNKVVHEAVQNKLV